MMAKLRCGLRTLLSMALIMGLSWFPVVWADLDDGLVAHYPFDGNANDESGNGNHGTEHGDVNYVSGKMGQAIKFDGINNYVEVENSPSLELNRQFTISYAIAPQLQPVPAHPNWQAVMPVVMKGRHTGNNYSSWLSGNLDSLLFQQYPIQPYSLGTQHTFAVSTSLVANEFVRITMLREGSQVKIYLNGKLLSEYEANYDANERDESLFIGYDGGYGYKKFKGVLDDLRIYNRALSECEIQSLYTGQDECNSPTACQLYGVHDEGLNNTQFFTVSPETFEVKALGDMKKAHDIEALDTHPQTGELIAASGRDTAKKGHLYKVDKLNGSLTDIGTTGFKEIDALSFAPDGILYGWAQDAGLFKVNLDDLNSLKVIIPSNGVEVEDITWNTLGTILYGVANLRDNPDVGVELLVYDGNTVKSVCQNLTDLEIEALDSLPDDSLLFGIHGKTNLLLGAIDVTNCQIIAEKEIATDYNDVEGIAWPAKACAPQDVAHSCQEIKENAPSSEDGIYQIDPDGTGGNQAFEVYCDMSTDDGGFTFGIGNTVINSFDSIKEGCPKGLSPFQLTSDSHGIALHNYVANQLEGNTQYWANVFAGPHKHTSYPGHSDHEYGYLDSNGEWHNAGINESQSPYHDIPKNWNLKIFDPIPLVGGTGYYADAQMVLYNSTERVIEGYAICSTNDK